MLRQRYRKATLSTERIKKLNRLDFRPLKMGMVESHRHGTVKTVKIEQRPSAVGVHQVAALAALEVDDDAETVQQDVFFQVLHHRVG